MTWVDMVKAFHVKYGAPVAERPGLLDVARTRLRDNLIDEEVSETFEAMHESLLVADSTLALAQVADGLTDTIYVLIGTALEYGIDIDRVFAEVHRSNMTKTVDGWARAFRWQNHEGARLRTAANSGDYRGGHEAMSDIGEQFEQLKQELLAELEVMEMRRLEIRRLLSGPFHVPSGGISSANKAIVDYIAANPDCTSAAIASALNIRTFDVQVKLFRLRKRGVIAKSGTGSNGYIQLREAGSPGKAAQ